MSQENKSTPLRTMAEVILDLSLPIPDARGAPMSANGSAVTYASLAVNALLTPYEGEDVPYETKIWRTELASKILYSNVVKLRFADCLTLINLVSALSPTPVVSYRFSRLIEDGIVATCIEQYRVERANDEARNSEPASLSLISTAVDATQDAP